MSPSLESIAKQIYDHARSEGAGHEEALRRSISTVPLISPGASPQAVSSIGIYLQSFAHTQASATVMGGEQPFSPWFDPSLKESWLRWRRYRRYLLERKNWAFDSVTALDASSDSIVGQLGDPRGPTPFDRRGLVVGSVQSGKTASYMALMAKAVDAGYRVVIVLAGIHNSLRHQTQARIDEEIVGVGTQLGSTIKQLVGVGLLEPQNQHPPMNYLTGRGENGDFSAEVARKVGVHVGQTPLLLVVKKNVTVLEHLVSYLRGLPQSVVGPDGLRQLPGVPLLLVDDEADQASVNFRSVRNDNDELDPSLDPSRINEQIRKLLMAFSQRTYVGYTATPFANVLIPLQGDHPSLGPDLFPRDFIIALHPPDDYVGPKRVFGAGPLADGSEDNGLPVVRAVTDHGDFMPEKHKPDFIPGELPGTLRTALLTYLLAGAVRLCRGQEKRHHTMLVHVTRYTAVQGRVASLMDLVLKRLLAILEYGSGAPGTPESKESLLAEFQVIWEKDIVPTSTTMGEALPSWEEVQGQILTGLRRVSVLRINGDAGDVLDYEQHALDGAWVLAVGGDKLSRGLTLEGLCVSYYLRASRTYDTLMQMGRWFGYRPGYGDLCRIFTTPELISWFQHIVVATDELWNEFETMQRLGKTPREFGLRMMAHPSMEVTSPLKMREAEHVSLNYSGTVPETIMFDLSPATIQVNQASVGTLVGQLGQPAPREGNRGPLLWTGVPASTITGFLRSYKTHPEALTVISSRMADYIEQHIPGEILSTWTVALMSAKTPGAKVGSGTVTGFEVNRYQRAKATASSPTCTRIRRMLSPSDELIDLDTQEIKLLARHRPGKSLLDEVTAQDARGYDIEEAPFRVGRPPSRGLLILYPLVLGDREADLTQSQTVWGLALSFPRSGQLKDGEFVANAVWQAQMNAG